MSVYAKTVCQNDNGRDWFEITGDDAPDFGPYALTRDGAILDREGFPVSGKEERLVRDAIEALAGDNDELSSLYDFALEGY